MFKASHYLISAARSHLVCADIIWSGFLHFLTETMTHSSKNRHLKPRNRQYNPRWVWIIYYLFSFIFTTFGMFFWPKLSCTDFLFTEHWNFGNIFNNCKLKNQIFRNIFPWKYNLWIHLIMTDFLVVNILSKHDPPLYFFGNTFDIQWDCIRRVLNSWNQCHWFPGKEVKEN